MCVIIIIVEKRRKRKGKKGKKSKKGRDALEAAAQGQTFEVETQDPRFKALFESHEFAIDPTNPKFKGTDGMKALLEEGRTKRKVDGDGDDDREESQVRRKKVKHGRNVADDDADAELGGLVKRLKGSKNKSKRA